MLKTIMKVPLSYNFFCKSATMRTWQSKCFVFCRILCPDILSDFRMKCCQKANSRALRSTKLCLFSTCDYMFTNFMQWKSIYKYSNTITKLRICFIDENPAEVLNLFKYWIVAIWYQTNSACAFWLQAVQNANLAFWPTSDWNNVVRRSHYDWVLLICRRIF